MSNNEKSTFVVWADNIGGLASEVEALSFEGNPKKLAPPPSLSGEFVVIHDKLQQVEWLGQIVEPQRNVPLQGLTRDNPSNIAAMERVLAGTVEVSVFLRQVYYYRIRLLGEINKETNKLQSVRRRPRAGSLGRPAETVEVVKYMDLPTFTENYWTTWKNNVIGKISSTQIPVPIGTETIFYHTLVAGATGSGKSNTVANIIKAAQTLGINVIVLDHKPDYKDIDQPNDEQGLFVKFSKMGFSPNKLSNVDFFILAGSPHERKNKDETSITVSASSVSTHMLATTLFYQAKEELQAEVFGTLLEAFSEEKKGSLWTLENFMTWFNNKKKAKDSSGKSDLAQYFHNEEPNQQVIGTAYKIKQRKPKWMDAIDEETEDLQQVIPGNNHKKPLGYFNVESYLKNIGKILSIRINAEGREYGLFLSFLLKEVYNLRIANKIQPTLIVIDEAQDIFNGSRAVRSTAEFTINNHLRKGRSKQIGFIFSVQSASEIPDTIANNLNSRIIHRQNSGEDIKSAIPNAPKELVQTTLSFGPGEALVSLYKARGTIHVEMAPSPFLLTKDLQISQVTMADQIEELPF
jgi:hypothetical protein